jgi:outer membrane protein insertion porin family
VTFIPVKSARGFSFLDPFVLDGAGNPTIKTLQIPILTYQTTFPGGDLQGIANFEYRIPIVGSIVSMALFGDVGENGIVNRAGLQLPSSSLQDLLTTFPSGHTFPAINLSNQLALASGTNFKLRVSTGIEFVVQIPIVQAPFRIYYAYNPYRLRQQIVAPANAFNQDTVNALKTSLPPGVFQNEILPQLNGLTLNPGRLNYFEPTHTFRFTVSRTF